MKTTQRQMPTYGIKRGKKTAIYRGKKVYIGPQIPKLAVHVGDVILIIKGKYKGTIATVIDVYPFSGINSKTPSYVWVDKFHEKATGPKCFCVRDIEVVEKRRQNARISDGRKWKVRKGARKRHNLLREMADFENFCCRFR